MRRYVFLFLILPLLSSCATLSSLIAGPASPYQVQVIQLCASPALLLDPKIATALAPLCTSPPTQNASAAQVAALSKALQLTLAKKSTP